jgi:hypothetical protein
MSAPGRWSKAGMHPAVTPRPGGGHRPDPGCRARRVPGVHAGHQRNQGRGNRVLHVIRTERAGRRIAARKCSLVMLISLPGRRPSPFGIILIENSLYCFPDAGRLAYAGRWHTNPYGTCIANRWKQPGGPLA